MFINTDRVIGEMLILGAYNHLVFGFMIVCNGLIKEDNRAKSETTLIYRQIAALCLEMQGKIPQTGGFSSHTNTHTAPLSWCLSVLRLGQHGHTPPTGRNVFSAELHLKDKADGFSSLRQRATHTSRNT